MSQNPRSFGDRKYQPSLTEFFAVRDSEEARKALKLRSAFVSSQMQVLLQDSLVLLSDKEDLLCLMSKNSLLNLKL